MPPRRSSRAPSAPVGTEILPVKRKRSQAADSEPEEKENVAKPASRTTRRSSSARPSVAPPSKGRAASRSKVLPDVQESGDEEQEDEPPIKKSRPSVDAGTQEEEDEEEVQPVKGRKSTKGRGVKMEVEQEPRSRRSSSRQAVNVSSGSRSSAAGSARSKIAPVEESAAEVEEEEEDEKPKPARRSRAPAKPAARKSSKAKPISDDDESDAAAPASDEDEDEKVKPARKGRKPKAAPAARKSRAPAKKAPKPAVTDDSDEDIEAPPSAQPRPTQMDVEAPAPSAPPQEEEEEKSLFDPPPMPALSSLPTTMPEEPSGPKSRLVIHKMALVNFKSYAGRQEIGPFHKSFSSIVGPNGSGKSNTIDALLFVFGYRASKMRQAKVSELIHNSARYPDLEDCSVEVHFREILDLPGPDAFKVIPGSKLVVSRQAYKNNQSKYMINGRTSTYSEVQTLLKGRGIDLDHKRFLILQGEVESIAQMKPKAPTEHEDGLLEYLEDIIGTSKYKEPIDEALVKMEQLQEERQVKLNRLRLVEKEKSALEAKKREAEDYLRLKNEHVRALSRLWQWYLWQGLMREEQAQLDVEKYQKLLAEETEKNKDDITHLEMLRKHFGQREAAYAEVNKAAAAAVKELAANERQEVSLTERRKHAAGREKKLKKSLQEDKTAMTTALRAVEESADKIKRNKVKVEEHEVSLVEEEKILEGIRDSLKDKTQVFHDQIEVKQKELQPWTAQINSKRAEVDVATSERDALAKKAAVLKASSEEAEENLTTLQADQQKNLDVQNRHKTEKANLQRQTQEAQKRFEDAQKQVNELRNKANAARNKVEDAKASQSQNRSQGAVLDTLSQLQRSGRIQGFHGRLGALGTIPDKYDVAISTACGGALSNMVVDTVNQGQDCIAYLRKNNIGRASFMILEKLPSNSHTEKVQTPENVPRLFDLIKPKEARFAPAFYKAIRDTLVADDMEQANRIAFGGQKRWRVVTLAGQVIETSGAMSGGGSQPMRGGMSSKLAADAVSPAVLREYEKDSETSAQQLQQVVEEARAAESEADRLSRSGPEIDMALQKLNLDIENGKKRISEAEKRVRDLKAQSKPNAGDIARISELEKEIASSTKALEQLEEKSGKITKEIQNLEKKILEIGGSKLLTQKSKVDGIRLHIGLANDEITKAEVAKMKAEKDSAKLETTIENNKNAVEEVVKELEDLDSQLETLQEYVTALREKVDTAKSAAENSKEDLDNLRNELDEKEEQISQFRQKEVELKQKLNDAEKEAKENLRLVEHWQDEHDKLKLEEIDDSDDEDDEDENDEEGGEPPAESLADPDAMVKDEPGNERAAAPAAPEKKQKEKKRKQTEDLELHTYEEDELKRFKQREMVADAELLDEKIKNAKPDLSVLREYKQRKAEYENREKDLQETTSQRDAQKATYDGLRKTRLDEFMAGFNLISLKLKEMYRMITLGGNAELELVDSLDPFSEGIIFSVMPPKKSWKNISNLSGGEKTLSSLALVFALHVFKPTPLYFMDEIDAALDFRNVSIVANYIKDRTKNAQFIIISLRNDMFELSHRLIGIYKTANATRSISIDNHALLTAVPAPNSSIVA